VVEHLDDDRTRDDSLGGRVNVTVEHVDGRQLISVYSSHVPRIDELVRVPTDEGLGLFYIKEVRYDYSASGGFNAFLLVTDVEQ
jgi:hypothetical protein